MSYVVYKYEYLYLYLCIYVCVYVHVCIDIKGTLVTILKKLCPSYKGNRECMKKILDIKKTLNITLVKGRRLF